jgi:hypothetical protein
MNILWIAVIVSALVVFVFPALGIFWSWVGDRACNGRPIIFDGMVIGHTRKINVGSGTFWVYRLMGSFDQPKGFYKWETLAVLAAHEEWDLKNWLQKLEDSRYKK